jgi:copper oxidase (laccase) domain-containing protein
MAGVPREQISGCGLCTMTHSDIFESYRVRGANAGRMAALIRVPAPRTR